MRKCGGRNTHTHTHSDTHVDTQSQWGKRDMCARFTDAIKMSLIHVLMSHETWSNQFNFLSLCLFVSLYHHSFRWFFLSSFFLHFAHSYPFYSLPVFFKKLATASKRCIHIRNVFLFMLLIYSIILITFLAFYLISVICYLFLPSLCICIYAFRSFHLAVRLVELFSLCYHFFHFSSFLSFLSFIDSIYLSICLFHFIRWVCSFVFFSLFDCANWNCVRARI